MKTLSQFITTLTALAVLAAIAFAAWLGLEQVVAAFAVLGAQVARVTAIAAAVVLLAAFIVAHALRQSGRDRLAVPLREEKAATYRLFVDCWQQRLNGKVSPTLEDGLDSLDRMLALFGSEEMVAVHIALRDLLRRPSLAKAAWLPLLGGALLQIRKELRADKVAASALELLIALPVTEPVTSADTAQPGAGPGALSAM